MHFTRTLQLTLITQANLVGTKPAMRAAHAQSKQGVKALSNYDYRIAAMRRWREEKQDREDRAIEDALDDVVWWRRQRCHLFRNEHPPLDALNANANIGTRGPTAANVSRLKLHESRYLTLSKR